MAICPVNAVSIPDYDMAEVEEFDKDSFVLDPGTYLHAVNSEEVSGSSAALR